MKTQGMSYKAKRNSIIIAVIVILAIIASIGTYAFISGNDETQAMSQTNGTSSDRAGQEVEQAQQSESQETQTQNEDNQNNEEQTNNDEDNEQIDVAETTDDNNDTTADNNQSTSENTGTTNTNDTNVTTPDQTTQTVTTTEEVERTETLVGFRSASLVYDLSGVSATIPDREPPTVTIKAERRTDNGREEITGDLTNSGSIYFTFTWSEPVEGFTREDISYEGFDHPESKTLKEIEPGRVYEFIVYAQKDAEVVTTMTVLANSVTDLANNYNEEDTVKTITIDRKAPEYNNMGIFNWTNDNDGDADKIEDVKYATRGSHIRLFVSFPEMLDVNPKVDIYGNDGKVTTLDLAYSKGAGFYFVEFDITDEMNLPEGKIKYKVYGYADEAGNVGAELTEEMTLSTQYPYVIYDVTPPATGIDGFPLYILSLTDNDHRQYIKDGVTLRVEANFNEPLDPNTLPVLTIGTDGKTQTVEFKNKGTLDKKYVYVADIKIDNSILQLNEGDRIEFTVTNVKDLAGNTAEFNNDNVTKYYKNDKLIYNQVTYDATAPEYYSLEILNNSHYKEYTENKDISVLQYATYGDNIKLLISFNEKLAVPPTLEIGGKTFTMNYSDQTSEFMGRAYYDKTLKIGDGENEITLDEGLVEFKVYGFEDAAGNTIDEALTEADVQNTDYIKVEYDETAPARVYSTVRLDEEKEKNPEIGEDENKYYYVKNGDEFVFAMAFTEELKQPPTVTIAGRNVEMALNEKVKEEESKYLYEGKFTIPADEEKLEEGKLEIKVSNIVDFAGNVMDDTIQTPTSNWRIVVYDRTAPGTGEDGFPLFILNYRLDDTRPYTVIKDGEKLFVEANFTEKLAHNPKISLIRKDETKTEAVEIPYVDMIGERYRYYVVLPFDAEDLQLENGDRIDFEITDVEDLAGNTATFNNDNVTSMKLDDGREYGQVFYDNKAPEYYSLEILNITHYEENEKIKKENENIENEADKKELKDLKVATTGDRIRVLISFPADGEKLAVEPKLRINGIECGTIPYSEPTSTSVKRPYYLVDFTIADETNIERHRIKLDEGLVNIEVYGYEDAAGNTISEPLTNKDIRNTNYTEVVYDVTAPVHYSLGIFNNTHYNENYNITDESKKKDLNYATTGDKIRIRISFEEKLAVAPKLKIGDKEIPWGLPFSQPTTDTSGGNYYYLTDIDLTEEMLDGMNLKDGAPIPIEVYGYEDAAGNVGDKITNIGENSGIRNDGEFTEVVYDISAPVILREGNELEDNSYVNRQFYPVIEDAGIDYATIIRPGKTEPENYTIDENNHGEELSKEGTYTITVYDKVGLSTTRTFTIDMTAPQVNKVHIYNKENGSQYIKAEDTIRVDVTFNEELSVPPTLTIGNQTTNEFKKISGGNGETFYQANLKLNADNELDQGVIEFTISGYKDLAGSEGDEVGKEKASKDAIYDSITPDNFVYEVKIQNNTEGKIGSPYYAKAGDTVWVYVTFNEELSVSPKYTFTIGDKTYEVEGKGNGSGVAGDTNWYRYYGEIKIDGSMEEGPIKFKIHGYKDLAGNEGKPLTDTTDKPKSSMTIDNTPPEAVIKYSHNRDNPTNRNVVVTLNPTEAILNIDGWKKQEDGTFTKEFTENTNTETSVTIYDLAGNDATIYFEVDGIDREAPVIHLEAPDTFEVGYDTYTYPEAGSVTDNYDATRGLASAVHMNWYKVNDDGTETMVDPFVWNSKLTDIELGKYHITYETTDKAGNTAKADRYVTLKDTKAPEIKFKNGGDYEFNLGTDIYTYPEDLTVTDLRDGKMSVGDVNIVWYYVNEDGTKGNVAISENFPWDTNLKRLIDEGIVSPGSKLLVEYWIKDEAGNTGRASRTVTFVDKTAPEIEFKGEDEFRYSSREEAIANYEEKGVNVSDLCDENVQNNVRIQINWYSIVDPNNNKEDVEYVGAEGNGRYNICYTVTDESGNKSKTIQRLVYVGMDN